MGLFDTPPRFDKYKPNYPSKEELLNKVRSATYFNFTTLPAKELEGFSIEDKRKDGGKYHWESILAYWLNKMYEYNHQPHHLSKQHKRSKMRPNEESKTWAHAPREMLTQDDIDRWQPIYNYIISSNITNYNIP
jgi:hypothetical protein